jgi:hypothetical protein
MIPSGQFFDLFVGYDAGAAKICERTDKKIQRA